MTSIPSVPESDASTPLPDARMEIEHGGAQMRFFTPNKTTRWRVETLLTKEPDTIEWIAGFERGDVLFDVGANVGMYSILSAATRGARVYAFEPEAQNYAILNTNILINSLHESVSAYCLAVADDFLVDYLNLSYFDPGGSLHNFGEERDYQDRPRQSMFRQGSIGVSLDRLVGAWGLQPPNHLKIDVDGIEPKIILGAKELLKDKRLRSVLIEINTNLDEHWGIIDTMLESGFDYSQDQVTRAQRQDGPFKGVGNYVFRR